MLFNDILANTFAVLLKLATLASLVITLHTPNTISLILSGVLLLYTFFTNRALNNMPTPEDLQDITDTTNELKAATETNEKQIATTLSKVSKIELDYIRADY